MKFIQLYIALAFFAACDTSSNIVPQEKSADSSVSLQFPKKFIARDYIELDKIDRISKFRSGFGHDYHDAAESCRSMKHYYQPKNNVSWASIRIYSPVTGVIVRKDEEWAGTQIWIQPAAEPAYTIIIFHIALLKPYSVGDTLRSGEQLGTHIGSQTMSDIAVGYSNTASWKLLSYFDVMTDSLFQSYSARGAASRNDLIITKAARDADPLNCSGDAFGTSGTLENWVILK